MCLDTSLLGLLLLVFPIPFVLMSASYPQDKQAATWTKSKTRRRVVSCPPDLFTIEEGFESVDMEV